MHRFALPLALALTLLPAPAGAQGDPLKFIVGAARPTAVVIPKPHPKKPQPLLIVLHGYKRSAASEAAYLRLRVVAATRGVVLAYPNGTEREGDGARFWNATDACCDFDHTGVDDVRYLSTLIDQVAARTPIDRRRVYLFGHSNGAFMAYRYACDASQRVAGIVVLAGAMPADASSCAPTSPVSVLHIHGTKDKAVPYRGGELMAPFPSAQASLRSWAGFNGCDVEAGLAGLGSADLDWTVPGPETQRFAYACPPDISVRLWRIDGGVHSPRINRHFVSLLMNWLLRQHR